MNFDGMTSLAVFVGIGLFSIIILGIVFSRLYRKRQRSLRSCERALAAKRSS